MRAANGESAPRRDAAVSQREEGQRWRPETDGVSNPTGHTGTQRINGLVILAGVKQEMKLSKVQSQRGLQAVT